MEESQESLQTSLQEIPAPKTVLNMPIARLQVITEVADRYKPIFQQLLLIFQEMYDARDKRILLDIQPLAAYIRPEKAEGFRNLLNEIRNHLNVNIKSSIDCRKRLLALRNKLSKNEDFDIIDGALDLLNLPSSSEIQSDADFKLLTLSQTITDIDSAIEIQEIFIYLNNLFQPIDEKNPAPKTEKQGSNKQYNKRR